MIKTAAIATLIAAGIALAQPAQAGQARAWNNGFDIQIGNTHLKFTRGAAERRHGRVSPRQIRRTVRHWGCYDISPVNRFRGRYRVTATCAYGERVRMVFSARSGRLLRERVIGFDRFSRGRRGRDLVSVPAYR